MTTTKTPSPLAPAWLENNGAAFRDKPMGVFYVNAPGQDPWYVASPKTALSAARAELLDSKEEDLFNFRKTVYFHCDLSRLNLLKVSALEADLEVRVAAARKDGYALCGDEGVLEIGLHRNYVRNKKALFRNFRSRDDLRYFLAELIDSLSPHEDNAGARFLKAQHDQVVRELEKIESERNTLRQLEDFIAQREERLNRRAAELSRHSTSPQEIDLDDIQDMPEPRPLLWN